MLRLLPARTPAVRSSARIAIFRRGMWSIESASCNTLPGARRSYAHSPSHAEETTRVIRAVRDAMITTAVGVVVLFAGGIAYMAWYREKVLWKIEKAFTSGNDPAVAFVLSVIHKSREEERERSNGDRTWDLDGASSWTQYLRRNEQDLIDRIIQGKEVGRYFVLLGPKGTGKTTMILDAMQSVNSEGVAMCDVHCDLEVFRLRLGKALNYEYDEDTQAGLFFRKAHPREGSAALDIERALDTLDKVALRYIKKTGRPLVLVLNNVHCFDRDDDGRNMLSQLQQRAEAWASSGILTMVYISDDSWPFFVMHRLGSRMHVVSVYDLSAEDARNAARRMRLDARQHSESHEVLSRLVKILGGRLTYLGRATKAPDMMTFAKHMLAIEKAWLLSQIGLIPDCDEEVMEEQKWSSCSWLLLREFVRRHAKEVERIRAAIVRGEVGEEELENIPLPRISYYECRQIMARPDFMDDLDRKNIIAIDINHDVTPDSWLIFHAAEEVVGDELFDELLDSVRGRVNEIESQRRTRELIFRDVDSGGHMRFTIDKGGARST